MSTTSLIALVLVQYFNASFNPCTSFNFIQLSIVQYIFYTFILVRIRIPSIFVQLIRIVSVGLYFHFTSKTFECSYLIESLTLNSLSHILFFINWSRLSPRVTKQSNTSNTGMCSKSLFQRFCFDMFWRVQTYFFGAFAGRAKCKEEEKKKRMMNFEGLYVSLINTKSW